MPRVRVRKTCRGIYPPDAFPQAYEAVLHGQTIRGAARLHGVSESTLRRYMKKKRQDPDAPLPGYRAHNRVLSTEEEAFLRDDLLKARDIIGLSSREVRRLAFQLAREHGCKYPEVWATRGMAGKDWLTSFLERNGALSPTDPQCGNLQEEAEQEESSPSLVQGEPQPPQIKEEQQERSPSLDQVKPEPPQIKEEQEEILLRPEEAGGSTLTLLAVKSDDDDEKPEPPANTSTEHMKTQAYVEYCTPSQPTSDDQLHSSESDTEDRHSSESDTEDRHSSESDTEDSHSSESDTEDGDDWAPNLSEYKTKDIDDGEWETRDDELNDEFLQAITSSLDSARGKNDPIANYCTALADRMRELSPLDLCVLRSVIDGKVNLLLLAAARRDAQRENTARAHAKSQYTAHEQSTQTCD